MEVPVPSQESERSSICVLRVWFCISFYSVVFFVFHFIINVEYCIKYKLKNMNCEIYNESNLVHTATFSGSWTNGQLSPLWHFPNLLKNMQYLFVIFFLVQSFLNLAVAVTMLLCFTRLKKYELKKTWIYTSRIKTARVTWQSENTLNY